jgi:hypothetical protein
MTIAETTRPVTARTFLFQHDKGADTAEVLAGKLSARRVARSALGGRRRLSGSALGAVDREIATVADGLLNVDFKVPLVSGWRKYSDLTQAAKRTLAVPGSEEVVVLAAHRVIWACRPHIDLLVDGQRVSTIDFDMRVVFDLHGVVAVVRLGGLVALRSGECTIAAVLGLDGQPLAQRQRRMDLALVIQVDPTIPLLGGISAKDAPLGQRNARGH